MNLALPTLLLVAALIPGIAFVNFYYASKFPRSLASLTPLAELALYFFWAIVMDSLAVRAWIAASPWLMRRWHWLEIPAPDLSLLARCAFGKSTEADVNTLCRSMSDFGWIHLAALFVAAVVGASLAGSTLRRLVWALRLDLSIELLRMRPRWFYALQGRMKGVPREIVPMADVLVEHPEGSRLFVGIVDGFEYSHDGAIDQLFLTATKRYTGHGEGRQLKEIPGTIFVITGHTIQSINLRYILPGALGVKRPVGRWNKARAQVGHALRAFFREDP